MKESAAYLDEVFDFEDKNTVSVFDELPLWSSYFGAMILDMVRFKHNARILDIGCGTGFPLVELAQRFGENSRIYGIDPWTKALERIHLKLKTMNINNAELLNCCAEELNFPDNYFDLIISNVGINNVQDPAKVLSECFRVSRPKAQLLMTVNLPETMKEFYDVFIAVLKDGGLAARVDEVHQHISHKRKTIEENSSLITSAGFSIKDVKCSVFYMRFLDGTAFLNHHFIKAAFMDSWKEIVPDGCRKEVFTRVEQILNRQAELNGCLNITIPACAFDCCKQ